jgi:2-iminobutanoate/2-iminopropanoate deaminase
MSEAIERLMVPGRAPPFSHYCDVVRAGPNIWMSGAVGITGDGHVPDDVGSQFQVALDNLDACLRAAGGEVRHIVKVNIYLTNIADRAIINEYRIKYFGEHRPASTLVEVSALVAPSLKVEIEATAYLST